MTLDTLSDYINKTNNDNIVFLAQIIGDDMCFPKGFRRIFHIVNLRARLIAAEKNLMFTMRMDDVPQP